MMTVAITNHRDDTVGNITESEKEPVKRGLVMIGALKGEPSKALLERVETLTLLSSGNAYSIVTEERIILLVTEKRENSGWQAEIEKLKEKLTTLEELSALGISSEKEETASFYSLYLEAYEDLLKKSKKENHMQVSDLQENALRLADSIKGMEDYERIMKNSLCVPQEAMLPYRSWLFSFAAVLWRNTRPGEGNWIICPLRWQVLPHRKCLPAG